MFKNWFSASTHFLVLLLILGSLAPSRLEAQNHWIGQIHWQELMDGLEYAELDAPEKSVVNDSKLSILKLDTHKLEFRFLTASEQGNTMRTAPEWAEEFGQQVIVNAGMYSYNRTHSNKGYMRNFKHLNSPKRNEYYNALLALNPKTKAKVSFEILDTYQKNWDSIANQYHSVCQGMRMISGEGEAMAFSKRPDQSCSMVVAATDREGNIYLIFTRSPYTHRTMIAFLKGLPLDIRTTVYLEGGPEASFYVNTGDTIIAKYGSYISNTCDNDDNDHFWKIPNVIGIKKKK